MVNYQIHKTLQVNTILKPAATSPQSQPVSLTSTLILYFHLQRSFQLKFCRPAQSPPPSLLNPTQLINVSPMYMIRTGLYLCFQIWNALATTFCMLVTYVCKTLQMISGLLLLDVSYLLRETSACMRFILREVTSNQPHPSSNDAHTYYAEYQPAENTDPLEERLSLFGIGHRDY